MSELIKADNEYKEWIAGISTDFRKSQIRASMKINDEMLRFYWKLGKGISSMSEQFGYGMGFYKTVSDDLKSILPDVKSFSPTNLKYMRYFYEMYPDAVICPQVEDELITDAKGILQRHCFISKKLLKASHLVFPVMNYQNLYQKSSEVVCLPLKKLRLN